VHTTTIGSTNGASATTIQSGSGGIALNSGTGNVNISGDTAATTVFLGTGPAAKTVTVGSINTTSGTTIQSGSAGISVATYTNGAFNLTTGTGTIAISGDATNTTVNIARGAGDKTITIGSGTGATSIALESGTGVIQIGVNTIAHDITIGNSTGATGVFNYCGTRDYSITSASGLLFKAVNAGSVTMPLTPAVLALHTDAQTSITGDGTFVTINCTTEIFDQGSHYNGSNTFTAPVTGRYRITAHVGIQADNTNTYAQIRIYTTNRTYTGDHSLLVNANYFGITCTCLADMTAGDTSYAECVAFGSASKNCSITSDGTGTPQTWLNFQLEC
jgi:hypothetical protein